MKVIYQCEIDDPTTATSRVFTLEADSWPFPNLPAPGDGVVIDVHPSGVSVEQRGDVTVQQPQPGRRLTARQVERVTYRPAGPHVLIHLRVDGLGHDAAEQIEVLVGAGFRETT
jgi:hypothetical protein